MGGSNFLYPATPSNIPTTLIQPSAAFKKEVRAVLASIILFFVTYLLLFFLSIGLIIGCVYAGIAIITHIRHLIAILAGAGLIGLGIMVFIFLVKFLFAVSRFDRSHSIEITEDEQPELFAFIRRVTNDTQTPFPKKIYLSPDVNACVFYDSSFWSMFFPIRKNLQIGLGLVNSVNVSEFKAVMAHEFGHFSQRSMKLGSFVYNVNRVIHNMLFENTSYSSFLGSWASVSDVFAFFANITARIAQGIQWVLRQVYAVINRNYMGLSREMEFHADAVAASVSGSKSLVTALRRLELADAGYNLALQKCDDLFREKKISRNIYHNHTTILKHLVKEYKLEESHGLPVITQPITGTDDGGRINFKDQWASHPSTADREKHLDELAVDAEIVSSPAWVLFRDREKWQQQLTEKIYARVSEAKKDAVLVDNEEFEARLNSDIRQFSLPEEYNGFYDHRQIGVPAEEDEKKLLTASGKTVQFEMIFSAENSALQKKINAAAKDLDLLKAIAEKRIDARTFDFDGKKYKSEEAESIARQIESELNQHQVALQEADQQAIVFFLARAGERGSRDELSLKYKDYFDFRRKADHFLNHMNEMLGLLGPIYAGETIGIERIEGMIATLKQTHEPQWKIMLQEWILLGVFRDGSAEKEKVQRFIDSNYAYFTGSGFFDAELAELSELCNSSWEQVNTWIFNRFKSILKLQLSLLETKEMA